MRGSQRVPSPSQRVDPAGELVRAKRLSRSSRRFSSATARRHLDESPHSYGQAWPIRLLFNAQNRVFGGFGHPEFNYRLSWNLDLLLGFRVDTDACFPLLLYQLAEARQHKFAFFLDGFISKATEAI